MSHSPMRSCLVPRKKHLAFTPSATTSGLKRPSAVGPTELNTARLPITSTAPAAMTSLPSLGATKVFLSARNPPFPAELTTTTPRAAAIGLPGL